MNPDRILIVDDEPAPRRYLRSILERQGYAVFEAAGGKEALTLLSVTRPDLVLLDLVMPGMDGYAVCRAIKENPETRLLPVVVVTTLDWLPAKLMALELCADDFLNKPVNSSELTSRVRSLLALKRITDELENARTVLQGLARVIERRDAYTAGHGERVGRAAAELGYALGLRDDDLRTLEVGAAFHDLGKIGVPDAILLKPGRLTPEEYEIIKKHPATGADLCKPMRTLASALPIIRHHHERLDGSGYPDGLSGDEIPVPVRIVSVVDIYDAMTSSRSYRPAVPMDHALHILREESTKGWWDREVVESWAQIAQTSKAGHPILSSAASTP
jgi:putative two-component system response regulator